MLQNQQEEKQSYVSPIANLRVTPQELAEAVAAVESRREGEGGGRDTIAIGDAIEQLGLSVTPQEVYAEIQKRQSVRREAEASPLTASVAPAKRRFRFRYFALALLLSGSLAMNLFLFALARNFYRHLRPSQPFYTLSLSNVTETKQGYATLYQLHELARGASPATTMLSGYLTGEAQWEVRKLDGGYVVRGYTYPEGVFNANGNWIRGDTTNFFSSKRDDAMLPRTVRLDDFNSITDPKWTDLHGAEGVQIPLQK